MLLMIKAFVMYTKVSLHVSFKEVAEICKDLLDGYVLTLGIFWFFVRF